MSFTYFIVTPGTEIGSYIQYNDGQRGAFFKFGDTDRPHPTLDIRNGYLSHNPDIGVGAQLRNARAVSLGTAIKRDLIANGWPVVNGTEWFSVRSQSAWRLFGVMQQWDGQTIDDRAYPQLINAILAALNAP